MVKLQTITFTLKKKNLHLKEDTILVLIKIISLNIRNKTDKKKIIRTNIYNLSLLTSHFNISMHCYYQTNQVFIVFRETAANFKKDMTIILIWI